MPLSRSETRSLAQDHPHLQADPTYARLVMRRISPPVTYALVRWTSLSADAVTLLAIGCGVLAALLVLTTVPVAFVFAAALLQLAYLFDTVDGEVARVRRTASKRGTYLDLIGHVIQNRALYAASSVVLLVVTSYAWWALGIALVGIALASPFGEQARAQVLGSPAGLSGPHGVASAGDMPRIRPLGPWLYWAYRRIAFLWAYPASMNLFCIALISDGVRMAVWGGPPVILAGFTAAFLGTLAVKQLANAIRLLDAKLWTSAS